MNQIKINLRVKQHRYVIIISKRRRGVLPKHYPILIFGERGGSYRRGGCASWEGPVGVLGGVRKTSTVLVSRATHNWCARPSGDPPHNMAADSKQKNGR